MGDINATELMTLNIKMFNQVNKRSCLEIQQATVSQKNYVLREPQRKQWDENPCVDIYWYYRIEKEISGDIVKNNENYKIVKTTLDKTNWQMTQLSAWLEQEITNLQIEFSCEIEKCQECTNYEVKR